MNPLLRVSHLCKTFPGRGFRSHGVEAVRDVSFGIVPNTVFGLVGESGSGKTTLARAVLYLDAPTSGTVELDGEDLGTLSRRRLRETRHKMQIVFQDPNSALNPKLSVMRSLTEGPMNRGLSRTEARRRAEEAADLVGIPAAHLARRPAEFSGGQKQRLVIARALTMEPEFLVLDEPVSNLDVSVQAQIINLLMRIREELSLTYLFISHDLHLISYVSDTVAVMKDGSVVESGPAERVLTAPQAEYTRTLFDAVPVVPPRRAAGRSPS